MWVKIFHCGLCFIIEKKEMNYLWCTGCPQFAQYCVKWNLCWIPICPLCLNLSYGSWFCNRHKQMLLGTRAGASYNQSLCKVILAEVKKESVNIMGLIFKLECSADIKMKKWPVEDRANDFVVFYEKRRMHWYIW